MSDDDAPEPQLPDVPPDDRARIVEWFNHRWELIESAHAERIELLRTVGEHPSPIFARMVKKFASLGLKPALVGKLLDVGVGTLAKHYQNELDLGLAETLAAVSTNMLRISMSEDNAVAAKVGMRILESSRQSELAQPVKTIHVDETDAKPPIIDSSKLTAEQRQQLREMLTYVAEGGQASRRRQMRSIRWCLRSRHRVADRCRAGRPFATPVPLAALARERLIRCREGSVSP